LIDETLRVEHIQDSLTFRRTQGPGRRETFLRIGRRPSPFCPMTVHAGSGNPDGQASGLGAYFRREDFNGLH
jgi:hypothetical protein